MGPTQPMNEIKQEKTREEKYNDAVLEFQCKYHCSPRKAKRALDAIARKTVGKFIKQGRVRQELMRDQNMLVDPTES